MMALRLLVSALVFSTSCVVALPLRVPTSNVAAMKHLIELKQSTSWHEYATAKKEAEDTAMHWKSQKELDEALDNALKKLKKLKDDRSDVVQDLVQQELDELERLFLTSRVHWV
ncbi:MAG: hypothetical protein MHM6MM_003084 [Cercozoa sp. M6MM]